MTASFPSEQAGSIQTACRVSHIRHPTRTWHVRPLQIRFLDVLSLSLTRQGQYPIHLHTARRHGSPHFTVGEDASADRPRTEARFQGEEGERETERWSSSLALGGWAAAGVVSPSLTHPPPASFALASRARHTACPCILTHPAARQVGQIPGRRRRRAMTRVQSKGHRQSRDPPPRSRWWLFREKMSDDSPPPHRTGSIGNRVG